MLELLNFNFGKWQKINKWMNKMSSIAGVKLANKNYEKMVPKMKQISPSL